MKEGDGSIGRRHTRVIARRRPPRARRRGGSRGGRAPRPSPPRHRCARRDAPQRAGETRGSGGGDHRGDGGAMRRGAEDGGGVQASGAAQPSGPTRVRGAGGAGAGGGAIQAAAGRTRSVGDPRGKLRRVRRVGGIAGRRRKRRWGRGRFILRGGGGAHPAERVQGSGRRRREDGGEEDARGDLRRRGPRRLGHSESGR